MDDDSTTIDSSSDSKLRIMEQNSSSGNQGDPRRDLHPISSSGADMDDDESETDELTIDDSCMNTEDMMDDDNNVAIVSSSTLHQMNEEEDEVADENDHDEGGGAASSGYMSSEPDVVAVPSKPLHEEEEPMDEECNNDAGEKNDTEQSQVSTSTASPIPVVRKSPVTTVEKPSKQNVGDAEDDDVDIDGIEEPTPASPPVSHTPTSPPAAPVSPTPTSSPAAPVSPSPMSPPAEKVSHTPPTSPPAGPESPVQSPSQTIGSPDGASQPGEASTARSPSPPQSPDHLPPNDSPGKAEVSDMPSPPATQDSQISTIVSQENFSQFDSSSVVTLSTITSDSSLKNTSSSQATSAPDMNVTMDEDVMDTSMIESSQGAEADNDDESQQSQSSAITPVEKEKSVPNGAAAPKSRSKSRSRSNTDDGDAEVDDVDLEDGEIMDDEEEEPKAASVSSKDKKEKDRSSKYSSSSSSKDKSSDKDRSSRDKDKDKEREKEKHRKDKKRSKREEEKEKESNKKSKKRKVSDAGESEQEEYLHVRGISPGSGGAPPGADPWGAVEEFGDDSIVSRAKRRRDSEGETSPHHHHHSAGRPPREPSPPAASRRPDNRNKRPVREERKEPKSDVICAYFMQGKCQKSAMDCTFSHDAVPPRKMELCKFWMMECCAKKEKCLYLHNDFPCKFFHTGLICKAADRCKFSHNPLNEATKQVLLKHIETAPKEILGDFPRLNRQGAINLINKNEARLRGEKVDDDDDFPEMNQNDHHGRGPMLQPHHDRHHGHGHGHGRNDDRHLRGGRDHHGSHGHHAPHNMNQNQRGNNNDMRGAPPGRGDDRHHNNANNNNNRPSRWEKQQPTRNDQEKLQELMEEAGISGFYKDTLETGVPPPGAQLHGPPGPFPPGMQPPLLPLTPALMSQMLPGFLPHSQPNTVNNPTLANVLASLNIPSTTIAPSTTLAGSLPLLNPGLITSPPNVPPPIAPSQASEDSNSDSKAVPDHLPKMQQELFKRIQKQQQKNDKKMQNIDKAEPEEQEENWYSSEDEEETRKQESSKSEISDKLSSVLNQIRQQSQPSSSPVLPPSLPIPPPVVSEPPPSLPSFYRDTDFRNQSTSFKDIDLRNPSSLFKKIDIEPAKEINASLAHNGPFPYKVRKVGGIRKIDYSSIRMGLPPSSIVLDPRLGSKRSNSIPTPASPTETSSPDVGMQPLTIPDGTPVFDPRTMRAGGNAPGPSGTGRNAGPPGITPQQNNPFLDSDNRFVSLPNSGINDFPSFFNRDPRASGPGGPPNQSGPGAGNQAQNIAAMAAAMAAMHQQLPGMPNPAALDPNLLPLLGFPFLPQPGGNPLDFQQMLAGGPPGGNLRMRPPFTSQAPPSSSWERLNQGQQGQGGGDLTPPL